MKFASLLRANACFSPLLQAAASGRKSSAYLLICEDEAVLQEASAMLIAALATGREDCESVADRVLRNGYADVRRYPEGDSVRVEDVNELLSSVYTTPLELNQAFYVVSKAETATEAAQNKLLKTLEESPSCACIVLLASKRAGLLPTVLSRCAKVELTPFSTEDLEDVLGAYYARDERFYFALAYAGGYPGIAESTIRDDAAYRQFGIVRETFLYMKTSKDLLRHASVWTKDKQGVARLMDHAELLLSDLVKWGEGNGNGIRLKGNVKDLIALNAAGYTSEVALKLIPVVLQAKQSLERNVNPVSVVDRTLYSILEVKTKCRK